MDLWLFAQRNGHGDIRYEKLTFTCRYSRSRLSERPSALRQLAALTANAAEGITGRQGGSSIRISVMDPRVRVDVEAFFSSKWFFRYLMHKWCNSGCYLSPLQRCLSLLSHTQFPPRSFWHWTEVQSHAARSEPHSHNGHLHYLKAPYEVAYRFWPIFI